MKKEILRRFYSQNGEDFILDKLLGNKENGFFVEIGCIDGKRFSNTLFFEEKGWTGLCIEAHAGYIDMLKRNRPNSIICHCAVGEKDEPRVSFYANSRGSLSTLDKSKEKEFAERFGHFFTGFEEQVVRKRTLNSIFEELNIKDIDILSLDVEGLEANVLQGVNLDIFRPLVIVVEADDKPQERELDNILLTHHYFKSIKMVNNIFYLRDQHLKERIMDREFEIMLTHTQHPLDTNGDVHQWVKFNTKKSVIKTENRMR